MEEKEHTRSVQRIREAIDKVFDVPGKICYCGDLYEGECDFCYKTKLLEELGLEEE